MPGIWYSFRFKYSFWQVWCIQTNIHCRFNKLVLDTMEVRNWKMSQSISRVLFILPNNREKLMVIHLVPASQRNSRNLPALSACVALRRDRQWCGLHLRDYSVLHRAGFTSSRPFSRDWWSLTPPFHPCLFPPDTSGESSAVYFLLHFPYPRGSHVLRGALSCGARTFLILPIHRENVTIRLTHFQLQDDYLFRRNSFDGNSLEEFLIWSF